MSAITIIQKGESLPFVFDRNGEDITNWICTIFVKQYPDDTVLITRVIDASDSTWPGFLTATETEALAVSSTSPYTLAGILKNSITDEEEQIPLRFNVAPSWG